MLRRGCLARWVGLREDGDDGRLDSILSLAGLRCSTCRLRYAPRNKILRLFSAVTRPVQSTCTVQSPSLDRLANLDDLCNDSDSRSSILQVEKFCRRVHDHASSQFFWIRLSSGDSDVENTPKPQSERIGSVQRSVTSFHRSVLRLVSLARNCTMRMSSEEPDFVVVLEVKSPCVTGRHATSLPWPEPPASPGHRSLELKPPWRYGGTNLSLRQRALNFV